VHADDADRREPLRLGDLAITPMAWLTPTVTRSKPASRARHAAAT
jgi:hypothetical protein